MKKKFALALSIAVLCSTAAPVLAGERAGAFSISPFVGGYTFDGVQHLETAPVFGLRLGYDLTKNFGVEAVGDYLATEGTRSKTSINSLSYRLDLLYNFMADGPLVPYLAVGGGGITRGHGNDGLKINKNDNTSATINAGMGIKYFVTDSVALRADARQLFLLEKPNEPMYNWEYTAGLTFVLGGKQAEVAKPVEPPAPVLEPIPVAAPAPAPPVDSDGDGVIDDLDKCPNTPVGAKVDSYGCPLDSDGDGVADYLDKCPNTSKGVAVDNNGCPIDTDGDGVADYLDKCPNTPKGVTVDNVGCPLDSDKDGVHDYLDKCPNTPAGVKVDENGCPPQVVERFCNKPSVVIVEFDTNKSDIKGRYDEDLNKLGAFLKEFTQAKGEISGHTDNVGSDKSNLKLSQRRAASVKGYLVNKFSLASERLTTQGYGESKPVESNKTKEGRQKNRRIETNFTCE